MIFGIAQHAGDQLGVPVIPAVEFFQAAPDTIGTWRQICGVIQSWEGIALRRKAGTGEEQFPLVWEMGVKCMALYPCALGDLDNGRMRRPQCAMQVDSSFDDAAPRFLLHFGPPAETVIPFGRTLLCSGI